jgi:hypothetical protein
VDDDEDEFDGVVLPPLPRFADDDDDDDDDDVVVVFKLVRVGGE